MSNPVLPDNQPFDLTEEVPETVLQEEEDAGIDLLMDEAIRDIEGWTA